jgi:hypothetical protein
MIPREIVLRKILKELSDMLLKCGDPQGPEVAQAAAGSEEQLISFLASNELWGGSGSVADQAGLVGGVRSETRRKIEDILIMLGEEQLEAGIANVRTAKWLQVFIEWRKSGI